PLGRLRRSSRTRLTRVRPLNRHPPARPLVRLRARRQAPRAARAQGPGTVITGPAPRNRRITPGGAVRQHLDSDPCAVYRIYDASCELVYIGMGHEPDARVSAHRADKPWREHIATYEVTWHPNRADAFAAEAKLVKAERPRYNVVHTPTHRERSLRH